MAQRAGDTGVVTAQGVLDGIPASAVLLDGQGRITAVNRAWIEFCTKNGGHIAAVSPPADYIAACADATPASTAREVIDGITGVLRGALDRFEFEYPCHGPDVERWFRMTVTRVSPGVLVIHNDITGEYAQVSRWLASTPTAILELDPHGNAVWVNSTWAELARRPTHRLLGAHWAAHLDPEQSRLLLDAIRDCAATGRNASLDVQIPDHEREVRMRFAVNPYVDGNGILRRITLVGIEE
jgi:PAS domain-containing protein